MPYVYILYSEKIDTFYIGSCLDLEQRLFEHNNPIRKVAFTKQANDWDIYYTIYAEKKEIVRAIEKHIKRMKSRKYLVDLKKVFSNFRKIID